MGKRYIIPIVLDGIIDLYGNVKIIEGELGIDAGFSSRADYSKRDPLAVRDQYAMAIKAAVENDFGPIKADGHPYFFEKFFRDKSVMYALTEGATDTSIYPATELILNKRGSVSYEDVLSSLSGKSDAGWVEGTVLKLSNLAGGAATFFSDAETLQKDLDDLWGKNAGIFSLTRAFMYAVWPGNWSDIRQKFLNKDFSLSDESHPLFRSGVWKRFLNFGTGNPAIIAQEKVQSFGEVGDFRITKREIREELQAETGEDQGLTEGHSEDLDMLRKPVFRLHAFVHIEEDEEGRPRVVDLSLPRTKDRLGLDFFKFPAGPDNGSNDFESNGTSGNFQLMAESMADRYFAQIKHRALTTLQDVMAKDPETEIRRLLNHPNPAHQAIGINMFIDMNRYAEYKQVFSSDLKRAVRSHPFYWRTQIGSLSYRRIPWLALFTNNRAKEIREDYLQREFPDLVYT